MDSIPGHAVIERLLALGDGAPDAIVRGALDTGLERTVRALFGELLPRLARSGLPDGGLVIDYRVRLDHAEQSFEIRLGPSARRLEIRAAPAESAHLRISHGAAEFADLFRALLGARHDLGSAALDTCTTGEAALLKKLLDCFADSPGLAELAALYGSCKWGNTWEPTYYEPYLAPYRNDRIKVLEIGAGGGPDENAGGESLRMWRDYFPRALIYGVDIFAKVGIDEQRIRFFQGDQSDDAFLGRLLEQVGTPDIIIDDGSHINEHVIKTFTRLFPSLADGGLYLVEDVNTSYWPAFGGSRTDRNDPRTTMGFLKALTDGLNHQDYLWPEDYSPSYLDKHIVGVHFHPVFVAVQKGLHTTKSEKDFTWEQWGIDLEEHMSVAKSYEP